MVHPLAGHRPPPSLLVNVPRLVTAYYTTEPDPSQRAQMVAFGTSGHRGSSLQCSFNEQHILAVCQAICEYRRAQGVDGPLFLGQDTHGLSVPAHATALEVFAANEVTVAMSDGFTPTPALSFAILEYNRKRVTHLADGVILTPSHNPPEDGGIKYNPTHGGPAATDVTAVIEKRANDLLWQGCREVKRVSLRDALASRWVTRHDFVGPYVEALQELVDVDAIRGSGLRIGIDAMGGAGMGFWAPVVERFNLNIEVVNAVADPTFSFVAVDYDGKIRMDCSSRWAMAGLVELKDRFDISFGNDTDYDRHGIVVPSTGLMNPNHYLAVAIDYLFTHRPQWTPQAMVGKTLVSSSMIDRVVHSLGRQLREVPVGFKWFVEGLRSGQFAFAGEESAGATFVRKDGTVWTTDKDGIALGLLAAEVTARRSKDPGECYLELTKKFGTPVYERIDAPATAAQKRVLKGLSPSQVSSRELAGDPIVATLTEAPGNGAAIGGLKVVTDNGWFAARPSGTEDVYKIYAESFKGPDHLARIQEEAQAMVSRAFAAAGA